MKKSVTLIVSTVGKYKLLSFALAGTFAAGGLALWKQTSAAEWVLASVAAIAIFPFIVRMMRDIRAGKFGIDILAVLAIIVAIILWQTLAAIAIVIMLAGGEALEAFAAHRAQSELRTLLRRTPVNAHLLRKGKLSDVRASAVQPKDTIIIKPGEVVPVDAIIIEGASSLDESSLTGESLPVGKAVGDTIISGSINLEGAITARATHTAGDSQYQQIIRLVRGAAEHSAPFVRLADRYSLPFTVIAITIGGVAWILSRQPIRFLDVLVVATPCPLILATPVALIAGMSRAARDGIIIRTGAALELLAQAKTFAFDKTGTLTYGQPAFGAIVAYKPFSKEAVLRDGAALEQSSNHPLAAAIVSAARQQSLHIPKAKHVKEIAGRGLMAHVQGNDVLIGRLSFMHEHGVALPPKFTADNLNQTATFVAIGGRLAGYITLRDAVRSETKSTLRTLRGIGIQRFAMVTGDNRTAAQAVAAEVGITNVVAETLPGDKLRAVEQLPNRPVAFVGDGVNDAPVLMAADVGIALGARGNTAAGESADVVIMKDDLADVARAVLIARRAFRIAGESIGIGVGVSLALMGIFATGIFPPAAGAIAQEALDVAVILNALRAHRPVRMPKIDYRLMNKVKSQRYEQRHEQIV